MLGYFAYLAKVVREYVQENVLLSTKGEKSVFF